MIPGDVRVDDRQRAVDNYATWAVQGGAQPKVGEVWKIQRPDGDMRIAHAVQVNGKVELFEVGGRTGLPIPDIFPRTLILNSNGEVPSSDAHCPGDAYGIGWEEPNST